MYDKSEVLKYQLMPEKVFDVFERHGMEFDGFGRNGHVLGMGFRAYSSEGYDVDFIIRMNDDELLDAKEWYRGAHQEYEYFDPWTEAHMWLDDEGKPVNAPFESGLELYEDIKGVSDTFKSLVDDLYEVAFKRNAS